MSETTPQTGREEPSEHASEQARIPGPFNVRLGAILAIAVAVGFIVWAAVGRGGDDEPAESGKIVPVG